MQKLTSRTLHSFINEQRGSLLVYIAICLPLIMAILLMTIDLPKTQSASVNNKQALDAAASTTAEFILKGKISKIATQPKKWTEWKPSQAVMEQYALNAYSNNLQLDQKNGAMDAKDFKVTYNDNKVTVASCMTIKNNYFYRSIGSKTSRVCGESSAAAHISNDRSNIMVAFSLDTTTSMKEEINGSYKFYSMNDAMNEILDKYFKNGSDVYGSMSPFSYTAAIYPYQTDLLKNVTAAKKEFQLPKNDAGDKIGNPTLTDATYVLSPSTINISLPAGGAAPAFTKFNGYNTPHADGNTNMYNKDKYWGQIGTETTQKAKNCKVEVVKGKKIEECEWTVTNTKPLMGWKPVPPHYFDNQQVKHSQECNKKKTVCTDTNKINYNFFKNLGSFATPIKDRPGLHVQPLSNNKDALKKFVFEMIMQVQGHGSGGTAGLSGIYNAWLTLSPAYADVWNGRKSSSEEKNKMTKNRPSKALINKANRFIIHITDGEDNISHLDNFGGANKDQARYEDICDRIKKQDVGIYIILYGIEAQDYHKKCVANQNGKHLFINVEPKQLAETLKTIFETEMSEVITVKLLK